ncbi:MAG: dienelactone hydrolase family protein [Candidatus Promineofilum sp.]|nr:dienelactone hydrolase family protein [Promineifilum sp.]
MKWTDTPQLVQTGPEWYEAGLVFRYQMPSGPGPYPTAVLIHGHLGNEDVMWVFRKTVPQPWLVVAPRAPLADHDLFSWLIHPPDQWPNLADFAPAVDALARFLRALPRLYNADPERMYLMGFSQGAAVAFALALTRPELVRGVAGLVGFAPNVAADEVAGRLDGLPVFMAAGSKDKTIPTTRSQHAADLLRQAGADLDYRTYPTGHKLTSEGTRDLREWFNQRV